MHVALIKYTVLRLGLFVAAVGVLALLGFRGLLMIAVAALISLALSYVLLSRQRDELARAIEERTRRRLSGAEADAAAEDGTAPPR